MGADDRIEAAFAAAPRELFLPAELRGRAPCDEPVPIGHGQTNSQPTTVRSMLELLDVRAGHRVLDVGSGSGWTTALLALLVGPSGAVYGVERVPELVTSSRAVLAALDLPWAGIELAGPQLGRPATAPYDRVLVSAAARELPGALVAQLADGGVLVAPVASRMARVVRAGDDLRTTWHGYYRFVPLIEG